MANFNKDPLDYPAFDDQQEHSPGLDLASRKSNLVWVVILLVFFTVAVTIAYVLSKAKEKPESPQALVVAAFNQAINGPLQEWKPGMGPKPLIYHPAAAAANPQWQAMYLCPTHGAGGHPVFDSKGLPYCSICNQLMTVTK